MESVNPGGHNLPAEQMPGWARPGVCKTCA